LLENRFSGMGIGLPVDFSKRETLLKADVTLSDINLTLPDGLTFGDIKYLVVCSYSSGSYSAWSYKNSDTSIYSRYGSTGATGSVTISESATSFDFIDNGNYDNVTYLVIVLKNQSDY